MAAILIDNKASITATTKNGFTPLHVAAKYGNINVTKILMQKESKLDAQGKVRFLINGKVTKFFINFLKPAFQKIFNSTSFLRKKKF